jgi:hypothetical protein
MRLRKLNNILHRDIGYFAVFVTIIYAVSGIAINHKADWNPNYLVRIENTKVDIPKHHVDIYKDDILKVLKKFNQDKNFKSFYFEDTTKAIAFFGENNMQIDLNTGNTKIVWLSRKPIFYEMNFLHYNPGILWTIFSDAYSVGLIIMALTGMFVLQGKKGFKGRGKWFVGAGIIIPVLLLIYYLNQVTIT